MTIFQELALAIEQGNRTTVVAKVQQGLDEGLSAQDLLNRGLIAAMDLVGEKMEAEILFIPEVLRAAKTMEAGLEVLKPLLSEQDVQAEGKVIMGTVKGDLHDIGKNLVALLLSSAGFEVIDLGTNVEPARFVQAVRDTSAKYVGMSALLTTTMPMMRETLTAFERGGVRGQVKVLVGGAPVDQDFVRDIGADGYASDAGAAIKVAKSLWQSVTQRTAAGERNKSKGD